MKVCSATHLGLSSHPYLISTIEPALSTLSITSTSQILSANLRTMQGIQITYVHTDTLSFLSAYFKFYSEEPEHSPPFTCCIHTLTCHRVKIARNFGIDKLKQATITKEGDSVITCYHLYQQLNEQSQYQLPAPRQQSTSKLLFANCKSSHNWTSIWLMEHKHILKILK